MRAVVVSCMDSLGGNAPHVVIPRRVRGLVPNAPNLGTLHALVECGRFRREPGMSLPRRDPRNPAATILSPFERFPVDRAPQTQRTQLAPRHGGRRHALRASQRFMQPAQIITVLTSPCKVQARGQRREGGEDSAFKLSTFGGGTRVVARARPRTTRLELSAESEA